MLTTLRIWFNSTFLNKVTFDANGKPYDCKGLRFKGGKPFGEGVEYYLTNNWSKWDYLGKGVYIKPTCITSDTENPYWMEKFLDRSKNYDQSI